MTCSAWAVLSLAVSDQQSQCVTEYVQEIVQEKQCLEDWLLEMVWENFLFRSKIPVGAQTLAVFLVVVMLQNTVQEYVRVIVPKGQCLET